MLVQSQTGEIELLPALPSAWKNGSFKGLKVRGGGEVSAKWKEGRLTEAGLKALVPGSPGRFGKYEHQDQSKSRISPCR